MPGRQHCCFGTLPASPSTSSPRMSPTKLSRSYQKSATEKKGVTRRDLAITDIGGGALPVGETSVTPRTLLNLAENPEVVAVMPNQHIHLIRPKDVDYEVLAGLEKKDKLTWGLKRLQIPKVWETTR